MFSVILLFVSICANMALYADVYLYMQVKGCCSLMFLPSAFLSGCVEVHARFLLLFTETGEVLVRKE